MGYNHFFLYTGSARAMTPAILVARQAKTPYLVHEYAHDPDSDSYGLEAAEVAQVPWGRKSVCEP